MDSRREKYLDKIVEHLVNRTKYDTDHLNVYIIKFPFSDSWEVFGSDGETSDIYDISNRRFSNERWNFDQEMIEVFDLIEHESDYVWEKYFEGVRFFGNEYAKSDGLINESVDKQKEYIDKVINTIVRETNIRRTAEVPFNKKGDILFPWLVFPLGIDTELKTYFDSKDPYNSRPNFHNYCTDIFGLNKDEMKFVHDKLNFIFKDKLKNLYDLPISRFNRLNESIEDKQKEYLIENYDKAEKFKNNIEKLLNQELELLIREDWMDEDSIKEIKSVESVVVDEAMRNVGHFDVVVFITLNIGNNGSRYTPIYNNYGGIMNYLGDKIREIIPNLKVNFKINYIDNQLSEQLKPNSDRQKEYLKKVVIRMIDETVPYRKFDASSVVTPFIAAKPNGRFVLSAHYCKEVIDNPDHYLVPKIITDYLDMYGLTGGEMYEVMYLYYNEIYNKYFKRFFDRRDTRRSKLSESVDLGYTDKIVDMVLREIVWDFDRGLVYLPMINYSASIRDDDFLSAVVADDAFTKDISAPNTNWHVNLMDHIENTYGITGSEWNSVWGSLQGEIWEKTEEYWDSFTKGY